MIIDFHTHTFPSKISAGVVDHLATVAKIHPFTDGSQEDLTSSMRTAGVHYSVNLPVITDVSQVEKLNSRFINNKEALLDRGIIPFGGIHPDYPDYRSELRRLKEGGIVGIKIHPAYHGIDLGDIRIMRIIDAASSEGLIVLTHAGIDIGIYDHNYAPVDQILKVVREVAPEKLVLAHMGNWACWDEVEKDLAGAPVWLDTAFSLGPVYPKNDPGTQGGRTQGDGPFVSQTQGDSPFVSQTQGDSPFVSQKDDSGDRPVWTYMLPDEDFVRLVCKHGIGKILFATDSPWADQKDYIDRIRNLPFNEKEREAIYGGNALELLAAAGFTV